MSNWLAMVWGVAATFVRYPFAPKYICVESNGHVGWKQGFCPVCRGDWLIYGNGRLIPHYTYMNGIRLCRGSFHKGLPCNICVVDK